MTWLAVQSTAAANRKGAAFRQVQPGSRRRSTSVRAAMMPHTGEITSPHNLRRNVLSWRMRGERALMLKALTRRIDIGDQLTLAALTNGPSARSYSDVRRIPIRSDSIWDQGGGNSSGASSAEPACGTDTMISSSAEPCGDGGDGSPVFPASLVTSTSFLLARS